MIAGALLYFILIGIAAWIPAPGGRADQWLGFRFFHAGMVLITALYAGNVILGIPLSALAIIIGVAAAGGIVLMVTRLARTQLPPLQDILHPVIVFAALVAAVAAARGGVSYLPMPGDETASWLKYARQIFLVDAYWSERVVYQHGGYPAGWPMLVALPNTIFGFWDDSHAALLPFLLHLGLIGVIFDVLRLAATDAVASGRALLTAWLGVLGLLAIEASWILVPRFLLVDEPITYIFIGALIASLLAFREDMQRPRLAVLVGLTLAAGYLVKIAVIALIPAILMIFVAAAVLRHAPVRLLLRDAALILLPFAAVAGSWYFFKTAQECNASPAMLLSDFSAPTLERLAFVGRLYATAFADYVPLYKLPMTLGALACLIVGLRHRRLRWAVLAVVVFIAAYSAALYLSYVACLDIIDSTELQSFQRYFLVNLRVVHVVGPIVLALWMFRNRTASPVRHAIAGRRFTSLATTTIATLLAFQVWMANRSLDDLATRGLQDVEVRSAIARMKNEATSLRHMIERQDMTAPRVSMIDQGGYGVMFDLGAYFGLRTHRDGESNFTYRVELPYFWNETQVNFATAVTDQSRLVNWWRRFDILWPVKMDAFAQAALERLVDDPRCRARPVDYFLIRGPSGGFVCIAKSG